MAKILLHDGEYKFMKLLWSNEPLKSSHLVDLCKESLGWKKSTVYTTIKRLSAKGLVISEATIVRSLISEEEAALTHARDSIDRFYDGSLQKFFASFLKSEDLSEEDIKALREMIDCKMMEEK